MSDIVILEVKIDATPFKFNLSLLKVFTINPEGQCRIVIAPRFWSGCGSASLPGNRARQVDPAQTTAG